MISLQLDNGIKTAKEYYNRDKYRSDTKTLSAAVSSMLLKEIYGGAAE